MLAVTDPAAFARAWSVLLAGGMDVSVEPGRALAPAELLAVVA